MTDKSLAVFENYKIRRQYDEKTETWYFSVVDILQVLIQQPDYQTSRKYWNKLKERLKKEGNESVTNCHQLKMEAAEGVAENRRRRVEARGRPSPLIKNQGAHVIYLRGMMEKLARVG